MSRGLAKLNPPEEWALNFLRNDLDKQFPKGYEIDPQKNDPPDVIVRDIEDKSKSLAIEFAALGPTKIFHFYKAFLRQKGPCFWKIRIPYEPEVWVRDLVKRKSFAKSNKYQLLCTHFPSEFTFPESQEAVLHADQNFVPLRITKDFLMRLHRASWECRQDGKAIVFVHPECEPIRLSSVVEPPEPKNIDDSKGYPTIQTWIANIPHNEHITPGNMPIRPVDIPPFNKEWKVPEDWRIDYPRWGQKIRLVNKKANETVPVKVGLYEVSHPSMPL